MHAILLALLLVKPEPKPYWKTIHDGYAVHRYYLTGYGAYIGDYYQVHLHENFTAQCSTGVPTEFARELNAQEFVEACK